MSYSMLGRILQARKELCIRHKGELPKYLSLTQRQWKRLKVEIRGKFKPLGLRNEPNWAERFIVNRKIFGFRIVIGNELEWSTKGIVRIYNGS